MPVSTIITAYNQSNLNKWVAEYTYHDRKLKVLTTEIERLDADTDILASNLRRVKAKISSLRSRLRELEKEKVSAQDVRDISAWISVVQKTLNRLKTQDNHLTTQYHALNDVMAKCNAECNVLDKRIDWLTEHMLAAEAFMDSFITRPELLVRSLYTDIQKLLRKYEDDRFAMRSPEARISLFNLKQGLNSLKGNYLDSPTPTQQYLRFSGMLWDMYTRVQQENQDEQFLVDLVGLVQSIHIDPEGDFEDTLGTGVNAVTTYKNAKELYAVNFVDSIEEWSKRMLSELRARMQSLLQAYEGARAARLSPETRISLFNLKHGANVLMGNSLDSPTPPQQYLRLCGMVWDMYCRVKQENQDEQFFDRLAILVDSTYIDPEGDAADTLGTRVDAVTTYKKEKEIYATYFAHSLEDLVEKERALQQREDHFLSAALKSGLTLWNAEAMPREQSQPEATLDDLVQETWMAYLP